MAKSERWPDLTRRVASDGFTLTVNGQEYHPHKGEWVKLKQAMSGEDMRVLCEFYGVMSQGMSPETALALSGLLTDVWKSLAGTVLDWNWRGPDGEYYAKPSLESIKGLMIEEIFWLVGALYTKPTEETGPNSPGESPSS